MIHVCIHFGRVELLSYFKNGRRICKTVSAVHILAGRPLRRPLGSLLGPLTGSSLHVVASSSAATPAPLRQVAFDASPRYYGEPAASKPQRNSKQQRARHAAFAAATNRSPYAFWHGQFGRREAVKHVNIIKHDSIEEERRNQMIS